MYKCAPWPDLTAFIDIFHECYDKNKYALYFIFFVILETNENEYNILVLYIMRILFCECYKK